MHWVYITIHGVYGGDWKKVKVWACSTRPNGISAIQRKMK
jgi:hypothetical protein